MRKRSRARWLIDAGQTCQGEVDDAANAVIRDTRVQNTRGRRQRSKSRAQRVRAGPTHPQRVRAQSTRSLLWSADSRTMGVSTGPGLHKGLQDLGQHRFQSHRRFRFEAVAARDDLRRWPPEIAVGAHFHSANKIFGNLKLKISEISRIWGRCRRHRSTRGRDR